MINNNNSNNNKLKTYNLRFEAFITSSNKAFITTTKNNTSHSCFKLILLMENGQYYELNMSLKMLNEFVTILTDTLNNHT
ncbi:hypothetical protein DERP_008995 [Dermatophagoides pteronyssinus]|uniref:Uncharacterized protein n=1 Tax=Dermatophagoides pteronyssinus TaxID=6956 RepID=A0ABQ8JGP1_DERPT|nr:hypothetical protein DERP_008995 [Dermatophagoides pteronyssinus]